MNRTTKSPCTLAGATGAEIKAGELHSLESKGGLFREPLDRQKLRSRMTLLHWANAALVSAVNRGLVMPLPCAVCGVSGAQWLLPDPTRPLDLVWLCQDHMKARRAAKAGADQ